MNDTCMQKINIGHGNFEIKTIFPAGFISGLPYFTSGVLRALFLIEIWFIQLTRVSQLWRVFGVYRLRVRAQPRHLSVTVTYCNLDKINSFLHAGFNGGVVESFHRNKRTQQIDLLPTDWTGWLHNSAGKALHRHHQVSKKQLTSSPDKCEDHFYQVRL